MRVVVGIVAGAVAGTGFYLTTDLFTRYCRTRPIGWTCHQAASALHWPSFLAWAVVAGLAIFEGFRLARQSRGWRATALGTVLWSVLSVLLLAVLVIAEVDAARWPGTTGWWEVGMVVVPAVAAYAIAAQCVGRAREPGRSPDGSS
ncbi:hypothetical protein SAMN05216188_102497 [Lentzea xinjiangensis]|uniref:Uncharacterized protein n=1 Tax=Lentzea xinjiangensis TaxID=402600 RepID=A0A1H9ED01_9PSEU|nr:hypothetical protein [Lentzea xinjiangensis]SEQ23422.1 hypothetical protein SAMN05216188_102497 [Lentzea xinjiangensis]